MNFLYLNYLNFINVDFRNFFESIQTPFLTKCMLFITDVGGPSCIALYCLVLVMMLWLHKKYSHAVQFVLTMGATALIAVGMKELIRLPRPEGGLISEVGYSFASAHAMLAVVFFTLVAYSYKNHFKNRIVRAIFILGCAAMVLLVSVSRIYLGVHYATDVFAGLLMGLIIAAISILMYEKHHPRKFSDKMLL
jgi:undecaprenyl-diphosphatase